MGHIIGVDIGSSFVKGAALDVDRLTLTRIAREPFPEPCRDLPAGHFEVDPLTAVAAVRGTIVELLEATPDCAGIVFSGQMGGVVLTDERGAPLTNYLSWRDQRTVQPDASESTNCFEQVKRQLGTELLRDGGQDLKPGSMMSLLCWLRDNERLPAGAVPLGLGEFVVSRLCGSAPATEPTSALGTLNLRTGDWHRKAFAAVGLEGLRWPALAQFDQPIGDFVHGGRAAPCYPVVGDHQAALAGSLLQEGELSINVSTGSQVSQLTPELRLGDYQSRPYFDGRFLNTITHLPAGRSLQVLVDLLATLAAADGHPVADPWKYVVEAADDAPESDLSVDLAFFAGPLGDHGAIANITTENLNVGTLFRAAFRNMAENYRACALRISPRRQWTNVVFSGGLVQKIALLRGMIADRLGGEQRIAPFSEDTLAGLLVLALVVSGRAGNVAQASRLLAGKSSLDPSGFRT
jgi:sugar (pentulose or hexulose) kinase